LVAFLVFSFDRVVSAPPVEYELWSASPPVFPAIPEFNATNSAFVPRQVNRPCGSAVADSIPNFDLGIGPVFEMYNHALDFNVAALNEKSDRSEPPAGIDTNIVMIPPAIDTRIAEAFPTVIITTIPVVAITPLGVGGETETQHQRQQTEQTNRF
jgi:hypothetical protein